MSHLFTHKLTNKITFISVLSARELRWSWWSHCCRDSASRLDNPVVSACTERDPMALRPLLLQARQRQKGHHTRACP